MRLWESPGDPQAAEHIRSQARRRARGREMRPRCNQPLAAQLLKYPQTHTTSLRVSHQTTNTNMEQRCESFQPASNREPLQKPPSNMSGKGQTAEQDRAARLYRIAISPHIEGQSPRGCFFRPVVYLRRSRSCDQHLLDVSA